MTGPKHTTHTAPVDPFLAYAEAPTFVAWQAVPRPNGKVDKVPINPRNGTKASTTDPRTWGTQAQALDLARRVGLAGIGVVFHGGNDLSGVDIDDCRDPATGDLSDEARKVADLLDSYTEVSASGTGIKVFLRGKLPKAIQHDADGFKIEVYSTGRFFTYTANHLPGSSTTIEQRQGALVLLQEWYDPAPKRRGRGRAGIEAITAALDAGHFAYRTKAGEHGTIIALNACLTSTAHDDGGYFVCFPDGTASYGCQHNSCAAMGWAEAAGVLGLPADEVEPLPFSDEANAQRLILLHGRDWRYCAETKTDHLWDGSRWAKDRTGEIVDRAKDVGAWYLDVAKLAADKDERAALIKNGAKALDEPRIKRMIVLARVDPRIAVTADRLDADRWLLNTPTGTVDLRTGEQRSHAREDLITRTTAASYAPWERSADWDRFLVAATEGVEVADAHPEGTPAGAEVRAFLQRLAGMSLTGDASEEVAPFVHGPERSGKSTFIAAMLSALRDYATTTDFETFLKRSQPGGIRTDLVRLDKMRMVASIEVEEGRELAAALFKRLTGRDTHNARGLYTSEIVLEPTQTFWLVANHAPGMDAADGAIWQRLLRVEFGHTVPPGRRDPGLKARLTDPATGGAAVLSWAIEGCLAWQRGGLRVPEAVRASTAQLREEMDATADFFADACEFYAEGVTPSGLLWETYQTWCRRTGEKRPLTRPGFQSRLKQHGCEPDRGGKGVAIWKGVALRPQEQSSWTQGPIAGVVGGIGPDTIIDLTNVRRPAEAAG